MRSAFKWPRIGDAHAKRLQFVMVAELDVTKNSWYDNRHDRHGHRCIDTNERQLLEHRAAHHARLAVRPVRIPGKLAQL